MYNTINNCIVRLLLQLMIGENESMRVEAEKEIYNARLQLEEDKRIRKLYTRNMQGRI